MLHDVLTNVLLAIGIIVGGTTLLDMLLGPATKSFIAHATIKTWSVLDDLRRIRFVPVLRTEDAVFRMSLVCAMVNLWVYMNLAEKLARNVPVVLGFAIIVLSMSFFFMFAKGVAQVLIPVLLRPRRAYMILISSTFMLVIGSIITALATGWLASAIDGSFSYNWNEIAPYYEPTLITKVLIVISVIVGMLSNIILITGGMVVVPVLLSVVLSGMLAVSEFVLRRIAESSKGPMLAIGGFCGAVASLLKVFA
jgi:hypothetical protein